MPVPLALARAGFRTAAAGLRVHRAGLLAGDLLSALDFVTRDNPFSSERARRELGWSPPVRPEAGMPEAFRWWKEHRARRAPRRSARLIAWKRKGRSDDRCALRMTWEPDRYGFFAGAGAGAAFFMASASFFIAVSIFFMAVSAIFMAVSIFFIAVSAAAAAAGAIFGSGVDRTELRFHLAGGNREHRGDNGQRAS